MHAQIHNSNPSSNLAQIWLKSLSAASNGANLPTAWEPNTAATVVDYSAWQVAMPKNCGGP